MTWRAQSYVPAYFSGKAIPSPNARVVVALDAIENGKRVNLSGATIYWYVDGVLVQNKPGAQNVTLLATDTPGAVREVRVQIHNLRETEGLIAKTIRIPVVSPQAIIEAPFYKGSVASPSFVLRARPFYFNIADPTLLSYAWEVDGKTPTALDNPSILTITLLDPKPGRTLHAALRIQNPRKSEEGATRELTLTFNP